MTAWQVQSRLNRVWMLMAGVDMLLGASKRAKSPPGRGPTLCSFARSREDEPALVETQSPPQVVSSPLRDAPFDAPFKDVGVGSSLHTDDGFEGTTRVCGKIHIQRDMLQPPTGSKLGSV